MDLLNIFNTGSSGGGSGPTMAEIDAEIDSLLGTNFVNARGGFANEIENDVLASNIIQQTVKGWASDGESMGNITSNLQSAGWWSGAEVQDWVGSNFPDWSSVDTEIQNYMGGGTCAYANTAYALDSVSQFAVQDLGGYYGVNDSMNAVNVRLGGSTTSSMAFAGGFMPSGALRPMPMWDADALADRDANTGMPADGKTVPYLYYSMTRHKLVLIDTNPADNSTRVTEIS